MKFVWVKQLLRTCELTALRMGWNSVKARNNTPRPLPKPIAAKDKAVNEDFGCNFHNRNVGKQMRCNVRQTAPLERTL